jgi:hypothetical protein
MKPPSAESTLILDGTYVPNKRGQKIIIDDVEMYLPARLYEFLSALVRGMDSNGGWVHKYDLGGIEAERKEPLIYRLRKTTGLIINNDRRGSYKLVIQNARFAT